jgi:NAD(P)-dependent dehydrogenase (short-subunit alcohol dehydrogenase family)
MKDLAGKTAIVTGAASGIGLGITTALAQAGVKVMLCDVQQDALDTALAGLKATNADVAGVRADVSLKAELQKAADETMERYGRVDIVVNNAGVTGGGGYGVWNDADWNWTIGVNLMAVIWGVEIFGPLIERGGQGGHIVNTASIAGMISGSGNPYNVTKYGVVALSEGLRVELAPRNIGVSVLCPGFIRTQIIDSTRARRWIPTRCNGWAPSASASPAASTRSMSASWCAKASRRTGPTSSPTTSSNPSSTRGSRASRPGSIRSGAVSRGGSAR